MGDRGIFGGGGSPNVNEIQYITISSTGNTTDFGDLRATIAGIASASNATSEHGTFAGGFDGAALYGETEYVTISTTGNAQYSGTQQPARTDTSGCSNGTNDRAVYSGGLAAGSTYTNAIDYQTLSTSTGCFDFGDLTVGRNATAAASNCEFERGITAGGRPTSGTRSNVIDYITISNLANSTDFGDLLATVTAMAGVSNGANGRGVFAGGLSSVYTNVIQYIAIDTLGNATDFGDLTVARSGVGECSNGTGERGVFAGGLENSTEEVNTIDYITINSTGNATDFGDISGLLSGMAGCSNANTKLLIGTATKWQAGVSISNMQYMMTIDRGNDTTSSIIYSLESGGMLIPVFVPTPTVGDRGLFIGGVDGGINDTVDYITISTTGNATDWGDTYTATTRADCASNQTNDRCVFPYTGSNTNTQYLTISSGSTSANFGGGLYYQYGGSGYSNGENERGIFAGGSGLSGNRTNAISYVTINSAGDATDFGYLLMSLRSESGITNLTNERGVTAGGYGGSPSANRNVIQYITINSTGNATDFGDLLASKREVAGTDNGENERGISSGGYTSTEINVIEYITINSASNSTDFGDLIQQRRLHAATSNRTNERGTIGGGYTAGSSVNIIDYITINSASNATDFGDLTVARHYIGAVANA